MHALTSFLHLALERGAGLLDLGPYPLHRGVHSLSRLLHLLTDLPAMLFKRALEVFGGAPEGILVHDSPHVLSCFHNTLPRGTHSETGR